MNKKLAETLVDLLEYDGDVKIHEDYSGRGMFGKTTTGISTDLSIGEILKIVIENANYFIDEDLDPIWSNIENFRTDQLGLGIIIY